jgi:hypothetical protein
MPDEQKNIAELDKSPSSAMAQRNVDLRFTFKYAI